jgi:hypothetical protein
MPRFSRWLTVMLTAPLFLKYGFFKSNTEHTQGKRSSGKVREPRAHI